MKHTRPTLFLLLASSVLLGACSATPSLPERTTAEPLLSSIELTSVPISKAPAVATTSAMTNTEQTLKHYQKAFQYSHDTYVLRRMADLSLEEAERRFQQYSQIDTLAQSPFASHLGLSKNNLDAHNAFLNSGLDQSSIDELQQAPVNANVYTAAFLYHTLLNLNNDPGQRSETLYQLAHAYSFAGEEELSLIALTELTRHHQQSPLYIEAQFRRAEILFKNEDFAQAVNAYKAVTREENSEFYQQSLYKLGWSHYKLNQYEQALAVFFSLYDHLHLSKQNLSEAPNETLISQLNKDTKRVVSLTLMQLEGPITAKQWFRKHADTPYEQAVYQHLGDSYLERNEYSLAAQSYATYAAQYPTQLEAPRFSQQEINTYFQGGLQADLLKAKINFVQQYGINSAYWQQHPIMRTEFAPQISEHIFDIAQHYHQEAQKNKKTDGFLHANYWYQQFLLTAPPSKRNAEIAHWQAQAQVDAGLKVAALSTYELSAYTWPQRQQSGDIAYEGLLLSRELYEQAEIDDDYYWQQATLAAGLRYAETFPQHGQVNPVLVNTIEDLLATNQLLKAIEIAEILLARQPESKLQIYALNTIANAHMDLNNFALAESHYDRLLTQPQSAAEQKQTQEQLALSIYRQAEVLTETDEWHLAASEYLRAAERVPHSKIRPIAQFDAANIYLSHSDYPEAIAQFKLLRASYPHHPVSETIPDKLAMAYENTNQHHLAAIEFSLLAEKHRTSDPELSRESLWRAAELEQKSGNKIAMRQRFEAYIKTWPHPIEQRAEAQFILAQSYENQGTERTKWINQLYANFKEAPDNDRVTWLAGWAALEQAKPEHNTFTGIVLDQPLRRSLKLKITAMRNALKHYQAALDTGMSDHVTQAQYQIGLLYETLANDLMNSERPPGLDEFELEMYELDLEERAFPYEDQAISYYLANMELVPQGIYDKAVRASYEGLARLSPGRYNKQEHMRPYVDAIY